MNNFDIYLYFVKLARKKYSNPDKSYTVSVANNPMLCPYGRLEQKLAERYLLNA